MSSQIPPLDRFSAICKGKITREKRLPIILLVVKIILEQYNIKPSEENEDGRINSCTDEEMIKKIIQEKIGSDRVYVPAARMWYDILLLDFRYGWLPVNIKTTTTLTSDNTGNLAMCVYAYTDQQLDLKKQYQNGKMSKILIEKLQKKQYNLNDKKDYYFIVVNKTNSNEVIINSIKGLSELTPNINNLPFQVCWAKNKTFRYKNITENVKLLIDALQNPKPSWKEKFMSDARMLAL